MLRPLAVHREATTSAVPLLLPARSRTGRAGAVPAANARLPRTTMPTRMSFRSKLPLSSSSSAPSVRLQAASNGASDLFEPVSVLEPLSYSQAMGGSAGFLKRGGGGGGGGGGGDTSSIASTRRDNGAAESMRAKFTRFAARFVGVALIVVMALAAVTPSAFAARSGGRMGGSAFGGAGIASHSFSSSSSYRGGSGFGGSRYGGGASLGTAAAHPLRPYSRSPTSTAPTRLNSLTLGWGLVPFGGFGYGGYPTVYAGGGGGGLSDFLFFGLFALIAVSAISSFTRARSDGDYDVDEDGQAYDDGVTVAKLQVGLLSSARGLKKDLERIAARADTSTPSGLHYVLQETVLSLLRNPEYAVYGAAKTLKGKSLAKAEQKFNEMSLAERGKVREETLVNVSGIRREGGFKGKSGSDNSTAAGDEELIVVTVLVASKGRFKLPAVRSGAELRTALSTLGAVPSDGVLGVEVLWTPQDPGDSYSKGELMIDFPDLNNL